MIQFVNLYAPTHLIEILHDISEFRCNAFKLHNYSSSHFLLSLRALSLYFYIYIFSRFRYNQTRCEPDNEHCRKRQDQINGRDQ